MSEITYRRYNRGDVEDLLDKLEANLGCVDELQKKYFARKKVQDLLVGNERNLMFFCHVALKDQEIIGCLCASIGTYVFSYEAYAFDHIMLVLPEHRSILVTTGLVEAYVAWARERRVKRVLLRNVTGKNVETFSRMAERFEFKMVGTYHEREL